MLYIQTKSVEHQFFEVMTLNMNITAFHLQAIYVQKIIIKTVDDGLLCC